MSATNILHNDMGKVVVFFTAILVITVGIAAGLVLIYLIIAMKRKTDFSILVFCMTFCQLITDALSPFFALDPDINSSLIVVRTVSLSFALISFTISTVISYTVFHVLYFKVLFELRKWYIGVIFLVLSPSVSLIVFTIYGLNSQDSSHTLKDVTFIGTRIALYARCVLIGLNIVILGICRYLVYILTNRTQLSDADIALRVLVDRMKYYPVMQVLCRILPATYYLVYDTDNFAYYNTKYFRFYFVIFSYIFRLFAPIGFLVIFLTMQPQAMKDLKNRLLAYKNLFLPKSSLAASKTEISSPFPPNKSINKNYVSEQNFSSSESDATFVSTVNMVYNEHIYSNQYQDSTTSVGPTSFGSKPKNINHFTSPPTNTTTTIASNIAERKSSLYNLDEEELMKLFERGDSTGLSSYNKNWNETL
jgi:hypothetical protein